MHYIDAFNHFFPERFFAGRLAYAFGDPYGTHDPTVGRVHCGKADEGTLTVMWCELQPYEGVSTDALLDAARSRVNNAFHFDGKLVPNRRQPGRKPRVLLMLDQDFALLAGDRSLSRGFENLLDIVERRGRLRADAACD